MINLRLPASTGEKPFWPAVGSLTTRITAQPRLGVSARLGLITLTALTAVAGAQDCILVQCESTDKHVALRFYNDHYLLHFHASY